MILDGKALSEEIKADIRANVEQLHTKGIHPKIAIVTVGPEGAWMTYVRQKIKFAESNNIAHELIHLDTSSTEQLLEVVEKLNKDPLTHGIIIQRPVPEGIDRTRIVEAISPQKDIDGFRDDSKFQSPIWLAILFLLHHIHTQTHEKLNFTDWIASKQWVVVGKGETGGRPTIIELKKVNINPIVIDSKTRNVPEELSKGDIIISGVGKKILQGKDLKSGVVLIGIGIRREEDGKLYGDYDEADIEEKASFYTPTPGGVGPLNLAFLFSNLIKAARLK